MPSHLWYSFHFHKYWWDTSYGLSFPEDMPAFILSSGLMRNFLEIACLFFFNIVLIRALKWRTRGRVCSCNLASGLLFALHSGLGRGRRIGWVLEDMSYLRSWRETCLMLRKWFPSQNRSRRTDTDHGIFLLWLHTPFGSPVPSCTHTLGRPPHSGWWEDGVWESRV